MINNQYDIETSETSKLPKLQLSLWYRIQTSYDHVFCLRQRKSFDWLWTKYIYDKNAWSILSLHGTNQAIPSAVGQVIWKKTFELNITLYKQLSIISVFALIFLQQLIWRICQNLIRNKPDVRASVTKHFSVVPLSCLYNKTLPYKHVNHIKSIC